MAANHPGFAIVGPPKTGTSALYAWLSGHPAIYFPGPKELHFFDLHRERGLDWYVDQFRPGGDLLSGEATPAYLSHPTAIEELAGLNPRIRLIVIARDPVERAWSQYNWGVSRGWYDESFEVMVIRELGDLLHGKETPRGLINNSRYAHHLERVLRHIPAEQLLVLSYEELENEPEAPYSRVCRFLGIDASRRPPNLGSRENETYRIRLPRLHAAILRTRLDRRLPEAGGKLLRKSLSAKGYPAIEPATRAALGAVFAGDDRVLSRFLGEDRGMSYSSAESAG